MRARRDRGGVLEGIREPGRKGWRATVPAHKLGPAGVLGVKSGLKWREVGMKRGGRVGSRVRCPLGARGNTDARPSKGYGWLRDQAKDMVGCESAT